MTHIDAEPAAKSAHERGRLWAVLNSPVLILFLTLAFGTMASQIYTDHKAHVAALIERDAEIAKLLAELDLRTEALDELRLPTAGTPVKGRQLERVRSVVEGLPPYRPSVPEFKEVNLFAVLSRLDLTSGDVASPHSARIPKVNEVHLLGRAEAATRELHRFGRDRAYSERIRALDNYLKERRSAFLCSSRIGANLACDRDLARGPIIEQSAKDQGAKSTRALPAKPRRRVRPVSGNADRHGPPCCEIEPRGAESPSDNPFTVPCCDERDEALPFTSIVDAAPSSAELKPEEKIAPAVASVQK